MLLQFGFPLNEFVVCVQVCGTDGQDYNNYAAMVVAGCRANKTIEVSYRGKCEGTIRQLHRGSPNV